MLVLTIQMTYFDNIMSNVDKRGLRHKQPPRSANGTWYTAAPVPLIDDSANSTKQSLLMIWRSSSTRLREPSSNRENPWG